MGSAVKKISIQPSRMSVFDIFIASSDSLRVYHSGKLIFSSTRETLLPLVEYLDGCRSYRRQVVIYDKIVGNAAALLSVLAKCREICSLLGSQLAVTTLERYRVDYHFDKIIPYIRKPSGPDMCPMEKLSLGMEPEEFYTRVKKFIGFQK
ncbi:DUF1893 domain-containing protein [Chloroflexota bacterium]